MTIEGTVDNGSHIYDNEISGVMLVVTKITTIMMSNYNDSSCDNICNGSVAMNGSNAD